MFSALKYQPVFVVDIPEKFSEMSESSAINYSFSKTSLKILRLCYGLDMVCLSPPNLMLKFGTQCGGVEKQG